MVRALHKRRYERPSDLVTAAKVLRVSVSHLRRVVVYKERASKSLLNRYDQLQHVQRITTNPTTPNE
jgi:hypothetical protein